MSSLNIKPESVVDGYLPNRLYSKSQILCFIACTAEFLSSDRKPLMWWKNLPWNAAQKYSGSVSITLKANSTKAAILTVPLIIARNSNWQRIV